MQIQIIKEKNGYFAQIIGQIGIHAIGKTPEIAVETLLSLYKDILELRHERLKKSVLIDVRKPLISVPFKSLVLNI